MIAGKILPSPIMRWLKGQTEGRLLLCHKWEEASEKVAAWPGCRVPTINGSTEGLTHELENLFFWYEFISKYLGWPIEIQDLVSIYKWHKKYITKIHKTPYCSSTVHQGSQNSLTVHTCTHINIMLHSHWDKYASRTNIRSNKIATAVVRNGWIQWSKTEKNKITYC